MRAYLFLLLIAIWAPSGWASELIQETVYVKSPTDTDQDGKADLIYVSISRPNVEQKVSSIYKITPYSTGGNQDAANHEVDSEFLPQDQKLLGLDGRNSRWFSLEPSATYKPSLRLDQVPVSAGPVYAQLLAHSLGTGNSTGCPTVGDMSETLAAKAVIDWLNGRAQAYDSNGKEVIANWSNGKVAMIGVSYVGTLPTMVAATGVEGLKAIVPIAAISNWYDYYRANGLVVGPGGYIGEDADVLGYFIYKKGTCADELTRMTKEMGRENGDYTDFWKARDYLPLAKNFKAATFIIHGQSDWNVKQKHAIQLYEALQGVVPTRMFLHKGGHGSTTAYDVPAKIQAWIDHFVEGVDNGIDSGPQVEVETLNGVYTLQKGWPHESTKRIRYYLNQNEKLSTSPGGGTDLSFQDLGKQKYLSEVLSDDERSKSGRLLFYLPALAKDTLLSGTSRVSLSMSVKNRRAANVTLALFVEDSSKNRKIITRGWVDPQNATDLTKGQLLVPNQKVIVSFDLEPKQYELKAGSLLGVMVTSTDFEYTLRPDAGTAIDLGLNQDSYVEINSSEPL